MKSAATLSGFEELHEAFAALPKATGKASLNGSARDALEPMRALAQSRAPERTGLLERGVVISRKAHKSAAKKRGEGAYLIVMHMGPRLGAASVRGQMQEFGTFKEPAQPFMRPAWDAEADKTLERIKADLWRRLVKATERHARKAARAVQKAGG